MTSRGVNRILIAAQLLNKGDLAGARKLAAEVAHVHGLTVEIVMVDVQIQADRLKNAN